MTLLELLEHAAQGLETAANNNRPYVGGDAWMARTDAARLRAAAERLRGAMESVRNREQDARDDNIPREWEDAALAATVLERINGGPLGGGPTPLPGTPPDGDLVDVLANLRTIASGKAPCAACVSEYGVVKADCQVCGGTGVCPSERAHPPPEEP